MQINETNEYFCVNCQAPLHKFIAADRRGVYSYCMDTNCHYSALYDSNYESARRYYMEHGENVGGFRFHDGEKRIEDVFSEGKKIIEINKDYELKLDDVIGLASVKRQLRRIVNVKGEKKIHCLIIGQAGLSKTHILKCLEKELIEQHAKVKYIDSSTASRSGIFDVLFEDNYSYILADELDKLSIDDQYGLLTLAESGILQQTTSRKRREKHVKNLTIIAAGNYIEKIVQPLLTRFLVLYVKPYSQTEFIKICTEMLVKRFELKPELAKYIAHKSIEYKKGNPNMRDSVRIALLVQPNPCFEEVDRIIEDLRFNDVPEKVRKELEIEL